MAKVNNESTVKGEKMKIKILVATHKDNPMPSDSDLYLPILVGANKNYNGEIGFELDNHGDNISDKNRFYNICCW